MNATFSLPTPVPTAAAKPANVVAMPTRHVHRQRDFGIGYGNSSGYASQRSYVSDWAQPRFRCA